MFLQVVVTKVEGDKYVLARHTGGAITMAPMTKDRLHSLAEFILYREGSSHYSCKEDWEDHMAIFNPGGQVTEYLWQEELKQLAMFIVKQLRYSYEELLNEVCSTIQQCRMESTGKIIADIELTMVESGALKSARRRWEGTVVEFHISEFTDAEALTNRLYYLLCNQ